MMEEKIFEMHDRRLNEHENRFNEATRNFTEIKDAIRQLTERINEGVSKTQQKILEENRTIEISLHDLRHAIELFKEQTNNRIEVVDEAFTKRIIPLEAGNRQRDRVYVWGILSGLIIGIVSFGVNKALQKFSDRGVEERVSIERLKSSPMRKG